MVSFEIKNPYELRWYIFGDSKIKWLQALDLWVTDVMLQNKNIDLNHFKSDVMSGAIEDSRLNFEDYRYGKGDLVNTKAFFTWKMD